MNATPSPRSLSLAKPAVKVRPGSWVDTLAAVCVACSLVWNDLGWNRLARWVFGLAVLLGAGHGLGLDPKDLV